ncbi:MAG TPA: 50S ribosomal protein L6 [Firmicutes bacterium]|jgi:large subunit ribosomal protein L6|nr:50S ribosomal protein L6 [Bacillota bacterium]
MSRIGRTPIEVPAGVEVTISGNAIDVKGPKGKLSREFHPEMQVELSDGVITVTRPSDNKEHRSLHGLTRTLIANMVHGVTEGFTRNLEIVGVGYRAAKQGNKLVLSLGYSHPIEVDPAPGIEIEVPTPTKISVKGIDKELVGQTAANIRDFRRPEPYLGKGVRYEGEKVRRKAGKAGKA